MMMCGHIAVHEEEDLRKQTVAKYCKSQTFELGLLANCRCSGCGGAAAATGAGAAVVVRGNDDLFVVGFQL
jgi:hypothetical protein